MRPGESPFALGPLAALFASAVHHWRAQGVGPARRASWRAGPAWACLALLGGLSSVPANAAQAALAAHPHNETGQPLTTPVIAQAADPVRDEAALPGFEAVRQGYRASDVQVLDRQGILLQRVRQDFHGRRGDWLALDDVSPALRRAVRVSEDRRFHAHHGVDMLAVASAAWGQVSGGPPRGASTLTMQLVGMLDPALRARGSRTIGQKLRQFTQAWALERRWTKGQIFEAYLNLAPFRGELLGIDAAARVLFRKYASGLDLRESALLAAMLRAPNVSADRLASRACAVLRVMARPDDCQGLDGLARQAIRRSAAPLFDTGELAPHAARQVLSIQAGQSGRFPLQDLQFARPGAVDGRNHSRQGDAASSAATMQVRTTLDAALQHFVLHSVQRRVGGLHAGVGVDAAVVVLDNASGEVLAYVGSSGELSSAPWVDHAQALRQAGSTLKPFLYAQAFDERRLTPASLLNDSPVGLATATGLYAPQNYDERFSGWVSSRTALASSLNIPAVRVLTMVSPEAFHGRLARLGLPLQQDGGFYGYSLALGSADVTLLSLTNAYRALANGGVTTPVRWVAVSTPGSQRQAGDRRERHPQGLEAVGTMQSLASAQARSADGLPAGQAVFSAASAWLVADILADRQARARTFGLDSPLETAYWSAVKTGTSKDMRDNWALGWSSQHTVGVWVGNSRGDSMRDVSGVSGAGPIWQDIMNWLGTRQMPPAPLPPAGIVQTAVRFEPAYEPPRSEVFLSGTQQSLVRGVGQDAMTMAPAPYRDDAASASHHVENRSVQAGRPRIAAPVEGTFIALDPDIPPAHQRLRLRAANVPDGQAVLWRVSDRIIGAGAVVDWLPQPGRHTLALLDMQGQVLDSISIQVRGAALRTDSRPSDHGHQ